MRLLRRYAPRNDGQAIVNVIVTAPGIEAVVGARCWLSALAGDRRKPSKVPKKEIQAYQVRLNPQDRRHSDRLSAILCLISAFYVLFISTSLL